MPIWIWLALWFVPATAAYAQDGLSDIENQAVNSMMACYQAHQIHQLVASMDEDEFARTVRAEVCTEQRQYAAQMLANALASQGLSTSEIDARVESFLMAHTTSLRMFYRRIKGAQ